MRLEPGTPLPLNLPIGELHAMVDMTKVFVVYAGMKGIEWMIRNRGSIGEMASSIDDHVQAARLNFLYWRILRADPNFLVRLEQNVREAYDSQLT